MQKENRNPVFVYGTLMRGERANGYLHCAEYVGEAALRDYAMYDLGSYPGIVAVAGEAVIGELYRVDDDTLKRMDEYEGEGTLYHRNTVRVSMADGTAADAFAYVYALPVGENKKSVRSRWNMKDSDPVWYAGYGSNLCADRFRCYIEGGRWDEHVKPNKGCRDTTLWSQSLVKNFPGRMYFASESGSWDDCGVAFYAPECDGDTVMRLYRITCGQLKDVQDQEGNADGWYGRLAFLGFVDGVPAYTFTSEYTHTPNAPGERYRDLIFDALSKECGMRGEEAAAYIESCCSPLPAAGKKQMND